MNSPALSFFPEPNLETSFTEKLGANLWQEAHLNSSRMKEQASVATAAYQQHKNHKHVVVIGTGGSTLGARMLCAFGLEPDKVLFAETIDVHSIQTILQQIDFEQTLFLVVSKSGSTIEPLSLYALFAKHYSTEDIAKHFLFITDPKTSPLRSIAEKFGITTLEHPEDIGGRFSVFTIVGLLPALFAEVDIEKFIAGANSYQAASFWKETVAWHVSNQKQNKSITVMLPYVDRLYHFTYWWRQLWAESLGKSGNFTTPFASIGSIDQHSQLQLWLDGPKDKSFVLISAEEESSLTIDETFLPAEMYPYTKGKTTQQLQNALVSGTIHSLKQAKLPVYHMHFKKFDVSDLGVLVTHSFAEVSSLAEHLQVTPFGQPAVEVGKQKTRELLQAE